MDITPCANNQQFNEFDLQSFFDSYNRDVSGQAQDPNNPYAAYDWSSIYGRGQQPLTAFNKGGEVQNYNTGSTVDWTAPNALGTTDFAGEGISTGLSNPLGNIADYLQNVGTPQPYQGNTIEPFNVNQLAGQQSLINAAGTQGTLGTNLANTVSSGVTGGLGYQPALQNYQTYDPSLATASQIQNVNTYDPAQQGQANYVNQYLNPAVQQAQQSAIANVNAGFGQSGTLGGARNARAASAAATQASLPALSQAAGQEFAAQQAINQANQAASNQAAQWGAGAQNQAGQLNQAALNQFALQNQGALNQAGQYGANVFNQNQAANTGALNQASQYNLGNQLNWAGQVPTAQQSQLAQGNTLQTVGQQQQDQNQAILNEQIKAWNYNQAQPLENLYQQLALGQIGQAAQAGQLGVDASQGAQTAGWNFNDWIGQGLSGALGGSGGIGGLLGGLFSNEGGLVDGYNKGGVVKSYIRKKGGK